ncbi:NAD-dependent deacetylase [Sulfurovum sp. XGS-02]|uniref:SIR2 family NAD-dependent protein deacylase n=1 Tax=Sulfurovum sp. XGS-02 TaxID=2925411 RepID=UPI002068FD99|nr:Sir2 family NAD-dependent protein deacetylase [Sulfurovum sp. XGS-02]UPT76666.1 NAD-dependent deacetylase [Sulfurovum sp. XGS-02]
MTIKKCHRCNEKETPINPINRSSKLCINCTLQASDAILVCAGAGMSVDSGLPTYRDEEGFWNDYPPYRELRKDYQTMASPYGFTSDPNFAWGFFGHQYELYKNIQPHIGYYLLLYFLHSKRNYFVVTTNVDGHFIKSGYTKSRLHEAHGSILELQCTLPCQRSSWDVDKNMSIKIDTLSMTAQDPLPHCPNCHSVARPNIFMFGDTDESYIWEERQKSADSFMRWKQNNLDKKVVILEIGVGAEGLKKHVQKYAREFKNATLIRINPEVDNIYKVDFHINKGVLNALKNLLYEL